MRRGRSTGNKTKAQQARLDANKGVGYIFRHQTSLILDDVRDKLWQVAGENGRVA